MIEEAEDEGLKKKKTEAPMEESLPTQSSVLTRKKTRQLERDRKRQAAVASLQAEIVKWKR
jgi:hypothetical protein